MRYIVYTWRGGYFTVPHLVEGDNWDEALWKGVNEAIKNDTIYYISDDEAYKKFQLLDDKEGYDDYIDYYIIYLGYNYYDSESDFIGFVCLENIRVISENDDNFERIWKEIK